MSKYNLSQKGVEIPPQTNPLLHLIFCEDTEFPGFSIVNSQDFQNISLIMLVDITNEGKGIANPAKATQELPWPDGVLKSIRP